MKKRAALIAIVLITAPTGTNASAATMFKNCTTLRKVHPYGVAKMKAAARKTGANYAPSVYKANLPRDRDKDGVACETK